MQIHSTDQSKLEATSNLPPQASSKPVTSENSDPGMSWQAFIQKVIVLALAVGTVLLMIAVTSNALVGLGAAVTAIGTVVGFWKKI